MKTQGAGGQQVPHYLYDASIPSIVAGGTPQLVLGQAVSRSHLLLGNPSAGPLTFEFGSARATAAVSGGKVTSVTVTNAGFGFSYPPIIEFMGGGIMNGRTNYTGLTQPNAASPQRPATGHCVMTGTAPNLSLSSIVIDDPGAGYVLAPYVFIRNSLLDPNGCAIPSATVGILLPAGSAPLIWNGTCCPTDAIAVYGATTGQSVTVKWMD